MGEERQLYQLTFGDAIELVEDRSRVACQVFRISDRQYRALLQLIGHEGIVKLIEGVGAGRVGADAASVLLELEAAG